jgi:anti-anti-sigma factor
MRITKRQSGRLVELLVEGRMDVHWSEHLAAAVREELRQGSHHIRLDLSRVPYLSSAGIGVLVRLHHEFKSIQGSFVVANCSPTALKSLEITNLAGLLVAKEADAAVAATTERRTAEPPVPQAANRVEKNEAVYEIFSLSAEAKLECRTIGDAGALTSGGFSETDSRSVQFSAGTFAIGLGALGECFADCGERFGEFIAAGGAVAYLPTDGTNAPDFLLAGGTTQQPEAQVCYAIACEGAPGQPFRNLIRFEAASSDRTITLSALLDSCLELAQTQQAGVVIIAESAGLVGAALRRPPVAVHAKGDLFEFPGVREWLSFATEPAHTKSVALLAGIAVQGDGEKLTSWIRPLGSGESIRSSISGHLHAAAFSYRPVPKGRIELKESVRALFEEQSLEGILHLLTDDRGGTARESEFVRGACWIAPIVKFAGEEAKG